MDKKTCNVSVTLPRGEGRTLLLRCHYERNHHGPHSFEDAIKIMRDKKG